MAGETNQPRHPGHYCRAGLRPGQDPRRRQTPWPNQEAVKYLCPPDGTPDIHAWESPRVAPFKDPLFVPPIIPPLPGPPYPPPNPRAHQLYNDYPPQKFYCLEEREFQWQFHSHYGRVTWTWGYTWPGAAARDEGCCISPGPTFHARNGEPILVRRVNDLPPIGYSKVPFAFASTTTHRHNGHQASESDGDPSDYIDTGDFWDHHYAGVAATVENPDTGKREADPKERLTTLWYHDHRMDFTAPNVYAGLLGFFLIFDEQDTGDENDASGWKLPSGEFDVPLLLHDLLFDENHQLVFDTSATDGVLGDRFTVNRVIQPYFRVQRRKYRFRILNGGPSRFYEVFLHTSDEPQPTGTPDELQENGKFPWLIVISGDGNVQPEPVEAKSIVLGVAQRVDVIIDFKEYDHGTELYLENRMDQHHGHGPSGRRIVDPEEIKRHRLLKFIVEGEKEAPDPSRVPAYFREFPRADVTAAKRERVWRFDYDGGIWTINGRGMDPHRIDAAIEVNSAEIWTFRNNGSNWWHPIHSHLSEWLVLEVNGIPFDPASVQINVNVRGPQDFQKVFDLPAAMRSAPYPATVNGTEKRNRLKGPWCGGFRRDIANLGPRTEVKLFSRWPDFLGRYVLHCHNVVHEDHAMMIRWDVVPAGLDFDESEGPKTVTELYGVPPPPDHVEPRPAHAPAQHGAVPSYPPPVPRKRTGGHSHFHDGSSHAHGAGTPQSPDDAE